MHNDRSYRPNRDIVERGPNQTTHQPHVTVTSRWPTPDASAFHLITPLSKPHSFRAADRCSRRSTLRLSTVMRYLSASIFRSKFLLCCRPAGSRQRARHTLLPEACVNRLTLPIWPPGSLGLRCAAQVRGLLARSHSSSCSTRPPTPPPSPTCPDTPPPCAPETSSSSPSSRTTGKSSDGGERQRPIHPQHHVARVLLPGMSDPDLLEIFSNHIGDRQAVSTTMSQGQPAVQLGDLQVGTPRARQRAANPSRRSRGAHPRQHTTGQGPAPPLLPTALIP